MDKQELINELQVKLSSRNIKCPKWELVAVIDPFIEVIVEALSDDKKVRMHNLGKFVVKTKKGRKFYNVLVKKIEYTPEKKVITFTPCKSLQIKINMHDK